MEESFTDPDPPTVFLTTASGHYAVSLRRIPESDGQEEPDGDNVTDRFLSVQTVTEKRHPPVDACEEEKAETFLQHKDVYHVPPNSISSGRKKKRMQLGIIVLVAVLTTLLVTGILALSAGRPPGCTEDCGKHGTCSTLTREHRTYDACHCDVGYTGDKCQSVIVHCSNSPCRNGGICTNLLGSYSCMCPEGFEGYSCEQDVKECISNPCRNDAICQDAVNGYSCICRHGFIGIHCERDIDECESNPCLNGASCVDLSNKWSCNCQPGFTGDHCGKNINECWSNPCQNSGACVDKVNEYRCDCVAGFTGANCHINANECASGPCGHNGWCIDLVNGYSCQCRAGYTGLRCEAAVMTSTGGRLEQTTSDHIHITTITIVITALCTHVKLMMWT